MSLLCKLTILIISACLVWGCKTSGTKSIPVDDSAEYYPPAPKKVTKADFRKYYRMASAFYDSTLEQTGFNGSILIAKGGEIIFEKYAGTIHLGKTDSIHAATPFHIASTTKTFTAMAVLKLAEAGKLTLNDSIQQYFPTFPYHGMTIKMLLSQRSGLPNYAYFLEKIKWDENIKVSNADILNTLIQYKPDLANLMNKRFNYSNTNFVLLALIIEKVSGMSYAEYLNKTFFIPLKMNHTYVFKWSDSATATPSYTWNGVQEKFTYLDITYGDKNIYSTVADLLKWDQALYNTSFFKQSTLDSAFQPYSFEKPGIHNYGLGWRMYTLPSNKKILYHNGWWHGSNATFYRAISDSLTIIIIGNKFNRNIYRVKPLIEAMTDLQFSYIDED